MQKSDVIKHILRNTSHGSFVNAEGGVAWAPSNVAFCKYWGKRDLELNLPATSSLSVSLGNKGTFTKVKQRERGLTQKTGSDPEKIVRVRPCCSDLTPCEQEVSIDECFVNGELIDQASKFAKRLKFFLDLFRPTGAHYLVEIDTNVPIAAGFASSACGFASLVQALDKLYDWRLSKKDLSVLARLGSGSASRSIFEGFVQWQKGEEYNGMDSYAVKLDCIWPELRIGMLSISTAEKPISSTDAMEHTVSTSPFYDDWIKMVDHDLANIKLALSKKDFNLLGEIVENNAIAMHALMNSASPPINYSLPGTIGAMKKVQNMRAEGVPVFFTQDAGPNLQLLFLSQDESEVLKEFPELEVVMPFSDSSSEKIMIVDDNDLEIGVGEKLAVHVQGKLHRAFSVFVLRECDGRSEVLLQQRSATKYHSANLWTNTCCGHPRPGEDIVSAAQRRLKEEMGFSVELKEIGKFHYKAKFVDIDLFENEIDHVLIGFSDLDDFPFDPSEVQNFCWVDLMELQQDLQNNPQKYTVWLPHVVDLLV